MLFKFIKKYLPKRESINQDKHLSRLGLSLSSPHLWRFTRYSVAKGVAAGIVAAFIPLPLQMVIAACIAIMFRCNIAIAVAFTWITNPITFVPINYCIFKVGQWVTGESFNPSLKQNFDWSQTQWNDISIHFINWLKSVGKPFLIGLPIVATSTAVIGYFLVHLIWKIVIYRKWQQRVKQRTECNRFR